MGREVRRVPGNWQHPKDKNSNYIPLYGYAYSEMVANWDEGNAMWQKGLRRHFGSNEWVELGEDEKAMSYEEWDGARPVESDYMPDWPESERTHLMMYEDTTEGTPISPAFETPEQLARWLADTRASAFAGDPATYEQWLATCKSGWAPSAVFSFETGLISGVAAAGSAGGE